ncbi:hypothetical protein LTR47_008450 [Exophiala xenobiotica]|nr:hypothetical protein LTR41_010552 [Exophiala xenobiotica]KAK5227878.1 hypothetical protein LTR47_008450 [Exophiala xenobiotica]KAK5317553.1 hypothetical protein LTR93_008765 [Exophiala xenobiotica]KAK5346697.1 hypothetical protein LTR61_009646 [Exophiala xenobiotica]KAK5360359.1 hypothetical protein LTR11_010186 [Exophiala xenobiotica]
MAAATTTRSYSPGGAGAGTSTNTPDVKYRRTNSLAFAKSDCHTCSSLGARSRCDRQRPRCTPCQDAGILCQGYSITLTWHQSHSVANKPPKVKSALALAITNTHTHTHRHTHTHTHTHEAGGDVRGDGRGYDDDHHHHRGDGDGDGDGSDSRLACGGDSGDKTDEQAQQSKSALACNESSSSSSFVDLGRANKRHKKFMFVAARPPKRRKKSLSHQSIEGGDVTATATSRRRSSTVTSAKGLGRVVSADAEGEAYTKMPLPLPLQLHQSRSLQGSSKIAEDRTDLTTSHQEEVHMPPLPSPSADVVDIDMMPPLIEDDPSSSVAWHQQDLNWISPPCQQPSENIDFESLEQCLEIQRRPHLNTASPSSYAAAADVSLGFARNLWDEDTDEQSQSPCSAAYSMAASDLFAQDMTMISIPQMCYSDLTDKFYGLLDMYDQEFCKYPITNDFSVNPYRYRPETTRGSQHLLHAIVALSCHFTLRSSTQSQPPADAVDHKNTALVLYQGALSKKDTYVHGLSLLDTAMALWQFEATLSALNIWRTHLGDAYSLLELCGGIPRWSTGIKANIQVAMFLWWDAMVSLLCREECVFPYSYFEAVLKAEGRQHWTFYELNGCPRELLVPMMQLCNLAAREAKESCNDTGTGSSTTSSSETVAGLVAEIELSIRRYEYQGGGLSDLVFEGMDADEEAMHIERDRYHCCEAFRYSLLIYILRIFTIRRAADVRERKRVRARLSFLSRMALEHVHACRASHLIQKQVLFPVFVAGAESRDPVHRGLVREYCERWYGRFGYQMYTTAHDVLRAVWAEQDAGNEEYWWGDELDSRRAVEGVFVQFCFG